MTRDSENSETSKDPFVHRMIPTVAAVGLTLGASACGGSGGSDTPAGPSTDDLRDYCSNLRSCEGKEEFEYNSVEDCIGGLEEGLRYYTEMAEEQAGSACVDATLEAFDCTFEESVCEMGEFNPDEDACTDEFIDYYDKCYSEMPGSM